MKTIIFFMIYSLSLSFTIVVKDIQDKKAPVYLVVFDSPRGFPEEAEKSLFSWSGSPEEAAAGISTDLQEGLYAIAVFQDTDLNNRLTKRFYGVPREPFGVSGADTKPLGPPTFKKSSLYIYPYETVEIILWKP